LYVQKFGFCFSIVHVVFAVPNGYHQGGIGRGPIHAETRWRPRLHAATRWRHRLHEAAKWQRVLLHAAKWQLIFINAATRWLPFFPVQAGFNRPGQWWPFSCKIQVTELDAFIILWRSSDFIPNKIYSTTSPDVFKVLVSGFCKYGRRKVKGLENEITTWTWNIA
jgi:hypothetical protein